MRNRITIAAVGDIFLGRAVQESRNRHRHNYIFELVRPTLSQCDIAVGNLESPITDAEITRTNYVRETRKRLVARPASLNDLKDAGYSAVSLANNHIMDFGISGLRDTIEELAKREIGTAGAGLNETKARRPLTQVGSKNVTLLSYYGMGKGGNVSQFAHQATSSGAYGESGGHNSGYLPRVLQDIQDARARGDIVLVALHWGYVHMTLPMKYQVDLAHQMIDNGANVIMGSGPHVLQPVERYNGGVIAYSLGNFVFDHEVRPDEKHSMILQVSFVDGSLESVNIVPILISADYRPQPITLQTHPELYESIKSLLVDRLDKYESDAAIISQMSIKSLTPGNLLKKLIWRKHGVYPLSFYMHALLEMIKQHRFRVGD